MRLHYTMRRLATGAEDGDGADGHSNERVIVIVCSITVTLSFERHRLHPHSHHPLPASAWPIVPTSAKLTCAHRVAVDAN